jgi:hypothetical protein
MEKFSDAQVIPGSISDFEMIAVQKGGFFLHGLKECVIHSSTQLCGCGPGRYLLDGEAENCRNNTTTSNLWIDYSIDSAEMLAIFNTDLEYPEKNRPSKLGDFLKFLENEGEINVKIPHHTTTRSMEEQEVSYTIAPDGDAMYKLSTKFPKTRAAANAKNVGAFIDFMASKTCSHTTWIHMFSWEA